MGRLSAVMRLTRIEHSVMLVIAVVAAEIICGGLPNAGTLALSLITPIFISMGAFAINDYFDREVDRVNKKMRPLVTGEISPRAALYITFASMAVGIAASVAINIYCTAIAVAFAVLALLYSYRLKEYPLVGNIYIGLSMAIPFAFGNYVVSVHANAAVMAVAVMILIAGTAREIDAAVRDYKGDLKIRNARTLPIAIGTKAASAIAFAMYLAAISISIYLFMELDPFRHNLVYLPLIAVVDAMLVYSGIIFLMGKEELYDRVRNMSLGGMALALVTILIASLVHI